MMKDFKSSGGGTPASLPNLTAGFYLLDIVEQKH